MREVVSGSLSVSRNDTAATLNRRIVAAAISPMKTRWRSRPTLIAGFVFRSVIVLFVYHRHSSTRALLSPIKPRSSAFGRKPDRHRRGDRDGSRGLSRRHGTEGE